MQNCAGCYYYKEITESLILTGQRSCVCRRYPPVGYPIMQVFNGQQVGSIMFRQAEVKGEGWCGEWVSENQEDG